MAYYFAQNGSKIRQILSAGMWHQKEFLSSNSDVNLSKTLSAIGRIVQFVLISTDERQLKPKNNLHGFSFAGCVESKVAMQMPLQSMYQLEPGSYVLSHFCLKLFLYKHIILKAYSQCFINENGGYCLQNSPITWLMNKMSGTICWAKEQNHS